MASECGRHRVQRLAANQVDRISPWPTGPEFLYRLESEWPCRVMQTDFLSVSENDLILNLRKTQG